MEKQEFIPTTNILIFSVRILDNSCIYIDFIIYSLFK